MKKLIIIIALFISLTTSKILLAADRYSGWSEILTYTKNYIVLKQVTRATNQTSSKSSLILIDVTDKKSTILSDNINEAVISPDKNLIAFNEYKNPGIRIYSVSATTVTAITADSGYNITFNEDSSTISYISINDKNIVLHTSTIDGKNNVIVYSAPFEEKAQEEPK